MKTSLIIRILIFSLFVSACSNKLFLQRKYTKGHYFARKTSIDQNQKATDQKSEWTKVVKEQPAKAAQERVIIPNEEKQESETKVANSKNAEKPKLSSLNELHDSNAEVHAKKKNEALYLKKSNKKRADLNNGVMSWAFAQFAGIILFVPFLILTIGFTSSITTGAFLLSLLLFLIGAALALKSITLGAEALRSDDGFFAKLIGLYGLLNGVGAFIFAIAILFLLIALI